jgi:hypothetical protein
VVELSLADTAPALRHAGRHHGEVTGPSIRCDPATVSSIVPDSSRCGHFRPDDFEKHTANVAA